MRHLFEQRGELVRRVVGAAEERLAVRGLKAGHGPAAVTGDQHHRSHVDLIHGRVALPVDLDGDEVFVQQGGDGRVFETLPLHHMAPVAGGVADGEEHRLAFPFGPREGRFGPGMPVHRVVSVLQQIGRVLQDQAVGV